MLLLNLMRYQSTRAIAILLYTMMRRCCYISLFTHINRLIYVIRSLTDPLRFEELNFIRDDSFERGHGGGLRRTLTVNLFNANDPGRTGLKCRLPQLLEVGVLQAFLNRRA